jgi:hypothetical protein
LNRAINYGRIKATTLDNFKSVERLHRYDWVCASLFVQDELDYPDLSGPGIAGNVGERAKTPDVTGDHDRRI